MKYEDDIEEEEYDSDEESMSADNYETVRCLKLKLRLIVTAETQIERYFVFSSVLVKAQARVIRSAASTAATRKRTRVTANKAYHFSIHLSVIRREVVRRKET